MFQVNDPTIVHETIDNETVIINTVNGFYYVAEKQASALWLALVEGYEISSIEDAYDKAGIFAKNTAIVAKFAQMLVTEGLIVPSQSKAPTLPALTVDAAFGNNVPTLSKHEELHKLIEIDPIHEVNPQLGWPFQEVPQK